jgi:hypothetical protein
MFLLHSTIDSNSDVRRCRLTRTPVPHLFCCCLRLQEKIATFPIFVEITSLRTPAHLRSSSKTDFDQIIGDAECRSGILSPGEGGEYFARGV